MLKFISYVKSIDHHKDYPTQYHWESRTAHILNQLWKDIEDKLPMPDMTGVPFKPTVAVMNVADYADVMPDRLVEAGTQEATGMATSSQLRDGKYLNEMWIPAVELEDGSSSKLSGTFQSMDLHIFQHEITHCYQNLWEWKEEFESAKKLGLEVGDNEEFQKFRSERVDAWQGRMVKHHEASEEKMLELTDATWDHMKQAKDNGMEPRSIYTDIVIPADVKAKMKEVEMYVDMIPPEKEMAELAGKVWTPHLTSQENYMLYHNMFGSVLQRLIESYETMARSKATRQKLEKIKLVPRMLQELDVSPDLAKIFREKAHHFIKMKYNYIEKAEQQLAA